MPFEPNDLSELDELTEESLGFSALSDGLGFSKGKEKGPHPAARKGQAQVPPASPPAAAGASARGRELPSMPLDEEDEEQLPSRAATNGSGAVAGGPIWTASSASQPAKPATPTWSASNPSAPQRPMPPSSMRPSFPSSQSFDPTGPSRPLNSRTLPGGSLPAGPARPGLNPNAHAAPAAAASPAPSAAQVLAEPAAPQASRLIAFLLDAAFVLIPLALAWFFSLGADAKPLFRADPKSPLLLFGAIFGAYFLLSESFGGQSLGKMILGLRVVEDDKYQKPTGLKHAALRLVLTVVGTLCFGLGAIASFRDPKRRPWQDRYTKSIVRRQAS